MTIISMTHETSEKSNLWKIDFSQETLSVTVWRDAFVYITCRKNQNIAWNSLLVRLLQ